MILSDPKAPFVFGMAMVCLLTVYLALYHPTPGPLAAAHARVIDGSLAACSQCHSPTGLTHGCLNCHTEIAGQVDANEGYHAYLLNGEPIECTRCHSDHLGRSVPLIDEHSWPTGNPDLFDHSHVTFTLTGAHKGLSCKACHEKAPAFALRRFPGHLRQSTFLGLTQDCVDCHEDIHAGGLARVCERCHSQETFRPAVRFDHNEYYALEGAHARVTCSECHLVPLADGPNETQAHDANSVLLAFDRVKGTTCEDCHPTPHRTQWDKGCTDCHLGADTTWTAGTRGLPPESHGTTGFPLNGPHAETTCEQCHNPNLPYDRRYPDPHVPGYTRRPEHCEGCHEDPHDGQFQAHYSSCLDCHAKESFTPAQFDVLRHSDTYPLTVPHAAVECAKCHTVDPNTGIRQYVSTPHQCDACHADPHEGQFADRYVQCTDCHDQERFLPARYDVARHENTFPLQGSHMAVPCVGCHVLREGTSIRRFADTPDQCKRCHDDPHAAQFRRELEEGDCTACHRQDATTFAIRPYDHTENASYPLVGAHAGTACADCHPLVRVGDPNSGIPATRIYRGVETTCHSCHADIHRGQFEEKEGRFCDRCHGSTSEWIADRFDHDRDARFALEGVHAGVACQSCHPAVSQPDGQAVIQYRPLGTRCEDCHGFAQD